MKKSHEGNSGAEFDPLHIPLRGGLYVATLIVGGLLMEIRSRKSGDIITSSQILQGKAVAQEPVNEGLPPHKRMVAPGADVPRDENGLYRINPADR